MLSTVANTGAVVFVVAVATVITLVEDLQRPNLIKAVKKVMRCNMPVWVGCCYMWLRAPLDKLPLI